MRATELYVLLALCAAAPTDVVGQRAILTGGLNLRTGPGRSYALIKQLPKGDTVKVLSTTPQNAYVHVSTADGRKGWLWVARVSVLSDTTGTVVDSLAAWDKPEPGELNTGACVAVGAGIAHLDSATDLRKNRVDTADAYHGVPFETILPLPWKGLPNRRYNWSPENRADVARYEGVPLSVEGYLAGAKEEGKEATNCGLDTHDWHDWHVWLVETAGEGTSRDRTRAIVVEVTPRVRAGHATWELDSLRSFQRNGERVRVSGWLMLDPDHPDQVGNTRGTTWEIHPIIRIEVWREGEWKSPPR